MGFFQIKNQRLNSLSSVQKQEQLYESNNLTYLILTKYTILTSYNLVF